MEQSELYPVLQFPQPTDRGEVNVDLPLPEFNGLERTFDQAALEKIGLSAEQQSYLSLFRALPSAVKLEETGLSLVQQLDKLQTKQSETLEKAKRAVSAAERKVPPDTLRRLKAIATSERKAMFGYQSFGQYCRILRNRFHGAFAQSQHILLRELLTLPSQLGGLQDIENRFRHLLACRPKAAETLAFWQTRIHILHPALCSINYNLDASDVTSVYQKHTAALSQDPDQWLSTVVSEVFPKSIAFYSPVCLCSDLPAVAWILGVDLQPSEEKKLANPVTYLYNRVITLSGAELLGTPAELLLPAFLRLCFSKLASLLYALGVATSFVVEFGNIKESTDDKLKNGLALALVSVCKHFFALTRCGELLGIAHADVFSSLSAFVSAVLPGYNLEKESEWSLTADSLMEEFRRDRPGDAEPPTLWTFKQAHRPWLGSSQELEQAPRTALGTLKADRTLNFFFNSDAWSWFKWAGHSADHEQAAKNVGRVFAHQPPNADEIAEYFAAEPALIGLLLDTIARQPTSLFSTLLQQNMLMVSGACKPRFLTMPKPSEPMSLLRNSQADISGNEQEKPSTSDSNYWEEDWPSMDV